MPGRSHEEDETGANPTAAVVHDEKVAGSLSLERLPEKLNEPPKENDIGIYVGCSTLPEDTKEHVYMSTWTPCSNPLGPGVLKRGQVLKRCCWRF